MRIVVDENIPEASVFARHGELTVLPGRHLTAADVQQADALIVRSVTQVNADLLRGSRVGFVGSCTIGTDHLDTAWLDAAGIVWSNAPGCNARSVVEYVLAALQLLATRHQARLEQRRFGIVGVGEVGQRLACVLDALGWQVMLCDPPREATGAAPGVAALPEQGFVSLDEVLEQCDVICLHTPLTSSGPWPTRHLLSAGQLQKLRPGSWLLNAGRGPVVDNKALLQVLQQRSDLSVVLDVWENEPWVDPQLAARCALVTPHIAGYSLDGKIRGTEMIYQAFCRHFELEVKQGVQYPVPEIKALSISNSMPPEKLLQQLSSMFYQPLKDDAALRATLSLDVQARAVAFDRLRKEYGVRREMLATRLCLPAGNQPLQQLAQALGMQWQEET